jgi:hypothetical protein
MEVHMYFSNKTFSLCFLSIALLSGVVFQFRIEGMNQYDDFNINDIPYDPGVLEETIRDYENKNSDNNDGEDFEKQSYKKIKPNPEEESNLDTLTNISNSFFKDCAELPSDDVIKSKTPLTGEKFIDR